jgi:hypothetical protein
LAALLGFQRRSARCSLYELHQRGCLEAIVTEIGKRWHLCGRGLRLIAAAYRLHIRNIADVSGDGANTETAALLQRGEAWLLQHIQHAAGIYRFFASLAQAARRQSAQALCWWETGVVCERRYRVQEQWCNLRPDAEASYRVGQQQFRFWLEWDRGTMNTRDLTIKFASYEQYIESREWAKEGLTLPRLFCVVPDIAQERRMQRVAQARLAHIPGLVLRTTTEGLLNEYGPLSSIWLQDIHQHGQMAQPSGSLRQNIFDMVLEKIVT